MLIRGKSTRDHILVARDMRLNPTPAEKALWEALRNRQLSGLRFYRQRIIGPYIVDFYCAQAKLIVEVDGKIHGFQIEYDSERNKYLQVRNILVMRFPNEMVINDIKAILARIKVIAIARKSDLTPDPSPQTRRGGSNFTPNASPENRRGRSDLTLSASPETKRGVSDLTPHTSLNSKTESAPLPLESGEGAGG